MEKYKDRDIDRHTDKCKKIKIKIKMPGESQGFIPACKVQQTLDGVHCHVRIMVLGAVGNLFVKPVGGDEAFCGFPTAKFHFCHD